MPRTTRGRVWEMLLALIGRRPSLTVEKSLPSLASEVEQRQQIIRMRLDLLQNEIIKETKRE